MNMRYLIIILISLITVLSAFQFARLGIDLLKDGNQGTGTSTSVSKTQ